MNKGEVALSLPGLTARRRRQTSKQLQVGLLKGSTARLSPGACSGYWSLVGNGWGYSRFLVLESDLLRRAIIREARRATIHGVTKDLDMT